MSKDPITAKVQALPSEEFGKLLYFIDEGDVILAKPKQQPSEETFQGYVSVRGWFQQHACIKAVLY